MRSVAHQLGNTPAVARGSYVDPRVIERFEAGCTLADDLADGEIASMAEDLGLTDPDRADGADAGQEPTEPDDEVAVDAIPPEVLAEVERAVVDLVERSPRRRARRRG